MRRMNRCIALLCALLLLPCLAAAEEGAVHYNPNGGSHFHSTRECPSISSTYYPQMQSASPGMLRSLLATLTPCSFCVTAEALNTWYGGAKFWAAWAVAKDELYAMGKRPYAPLSWLISPEKDELLICVLFHDGEIAQLSLTCTEDCWQLNKVWWLPALQ